MYQMYPSHPLWRKGDKFLIEPQLGGLSGPMKITIEHGGVGRYSKVGGLGNPEYLEPALAGIGNLPTLSPVSILLSLAGGIAGAVILGKQKGALFGVLGFLGGSTVGEVIGNAVVPPKTTPTTAGPIQIEGPGSNLPVLPGPK